MIQTRSQANAYTPSVTFTINSKRLQKKERIFEKFKEEKIIKLKCALNVL